MKPTQAQINEELQKLRDLAPRIRQRSAFGDDNRGAIEAQIAVLSGKRNLEWYERDGVFIYDNASLAHDWMWTGDFEDSEGQSLSELWEALA